MLSFVAYTKNNINKHVHYYWCSIKKNRNSFVLPQKSERVWRSVIVYILMFINIYNSPYRAVCTRARAGLCEYVTRVRCT